MDESILLTHSDCGHTAQTAIHYHGGRGRTKHMWISDIEAAEWGLAPGLGNVPARIAAIIIAQRALHHTCFPCMRAAVTRAARGMWEPDLYVRPSVARAVARVAALTGGQVTTSPKSPYSHYVTWESGAWRISDHPWPGPPDALIAERCWKIEKGHCHTFIYTARLRPNWLVIVQEVTK